MRCRRTRLAVGRPNGRAARMARGYVQSLEYWKPVIRERNEIHRTRCVDEQELQVPGTVSPSGLLSDIDGVRRSEVTAHYDEVRVCRSWRILATAVTREQIYIGQL